MRRKEWTGSCRVLTVCIVIMILIGLCSAAAAGRMILPAKTTRITDELFYGNEALDEVQLPDNLDYIGHKAFAESSVHYLYIPGSVTTIEDDAFDGCKNLICLVPEDSYAQEWCIAHNVSWLDSRFVESITLTQETVTIKNGATQTIKVNTRPAGAADRLVWVSSDNNIITVSQKGELFGKYPGKARAVVSAKDGSLTAGINVTVQANYRAVLFSESTFSGGVIQRNRGDVRLMKNMLASVTGPDGGKYKVSTYDDLVASDVYQKIQDLLIAPSRDGDVSMFFFASHGDYKSTTEKYAGRLWCKNKSTWLELPTLAKTLSRAKGKVIVLLESCGPGAALHEFKSNSASELSDDPDGSKDILRAFSSSDPGLSVYQAEEPTADEASDRQLVEQYLQGELRANSTGSTTGGSQFMTEKFVVMTASAYRQMSYMIRGDTSNLFPTMLTKGVGTSGTMPADTECGNSDGKLTLNELFKYVYKHTSYKQTPQVYPKDSGYILFIRAR